MKTNKFFQLLTLAICAVAFAFVTGCEGPEGPQGPAGANGADGADGVDGVDGVNGTDGTDGVDGNAVCLECHNLTVKEAVNTAYMSSGHGIGAAAGYAGGRNECTMCHSDQGFRETQYTGRDTAAAAIPMPQPIQCATCHAFHESLDFENEPNSALRTNDPVALLMYRADDPTADPVFLDFGDNSNLCANCHQPREVAPVADQDGNYNVTSKRIGPHHGPHATSLAGLGAYEVGTGYPDPGTGSTHASLTCITCHMYEGDHTWEPSLSACNTTDCHDGGLTSVSDNSSQTTFATLVGTLHDKLDAAGVMDADGYMIPGTYGVDTAGAFYNYKWLVDDRSNGVHNPEYLKTMLNNSIAVFQ